MRSHHRPAVTDPARLDLASADTDPVELAEAAHRTAAAVVGRGRENEDPQVSDRLVGLVDELGLATVAELWSHRPARSLPGALWRLYALHEWVRRRPDQVARAFTAGSAHAEVHRVIAGVVEPPSPQDLADLTRRILQGVYDGDLGVALDRASAFCHVMAVGLVDPAAAVQDVSAEMVRQGARMQSTAADLQACAAAWRRGDLH